jgi:hypothetical protein
VVQLWCECPSSDIGRLHRITHVEHTHPREVTLYAANCTPTSLPPLAVTTMPPKRKIDKISKVERELLDIAVRMDSAVRYWEKFNGAVDTAWYVQGFEEELVRTVSFIHDGNS